MNLIHDDALLVLRNLPDNSVDSLITDPPAGIGFMGKDWDKDKGGRDAWVSWMKDVMIECHRVLKPGAHGLVWALPRTCHWTAWALEEAGFEVRDSIHHIFGTGFPKSHNLEKATNGTARGQGTALKPAHEVWWLVRKPISEKTVAKNVLKHGTGGLNIDESRIDTNDSLGRNNNARLSGSSYVVQKTSMRIDNSTGKGRFPSNLIVSGEVREEIGEPAKFFYCAKESKKGRGEGNTHPTVKAQKLMKYLINMITPPGGIVLDPFMGSGSTGVAAKDLGFEFIGIEKEKEYFDISVKRLRSDAECA